VNTLMDFMVNRGPEVGNAFSKLSKTEQADVLSGRVPWGVADADDGVLDSVSSSSTRRDRLGSAGDNGCDGCGAIRFKVSEDAPDLELTICPRCQHARCDACVARDAPCFCEMMEMGVE